MKSLQVLLDRTLEPTAMAAAPPVAGIITAANNTKFGVDFLLPWPQLSFCVLVLSLNKTHGRVRRSRRYRRRPGSGGGGASGGYN